MWVRTEFISPTHGKLSFERMFQHVVQYMQEDPAQKYNLIIGTDSLLGDDTDVASLSSKMDCRIKPIPD